MIRTYNRCSCNVAYLHELENCPVCRSPQWASSTFKASPNDYIYDLETYPNIFTASFKHIVSGQRWLFEISQWRSDNIELKKFLDLLYTIKARMVGFNNFGFDYPIIHEFLTYPSVNHAHLYNKAMQIIQGDRFENIIWKPIIQQVDLFKIHHFDNVNRSVSLKVLEFNMRSESVEDLPFKPGITLTNEQRQKLIEYNDHDVDETEKFYFLSADKIAFREELSAKYNRDFLNHNDTKIGKDYFIRTLEDYMPGSCYDSRTREVRQTIRPYIALKDVILPSVKFNDPEFNRVKEYLESQIITQTKGVFNDLQCTVDGFQYHFGVGGIHGSINSQIVRSTDTHVIIDLDVASYYPNLAIANNLYPEHLSPKFCEIYKDVYEQRKQHAKGTSENATLKLALNGVYGDSNNQYSPFYDPAYTMSITINGQLLLCMLAEWLRAIPDLQMIQINTDGLTVKIPRNYEPQLLRIAKDWENYTGLTLEDVHYKAMYIRDVNNYIGEYEDGKLKNKGAYEHSNLDWHKNHSALVIPKAAEAYLVNGVHPIDFIYSHKNPFDFMLRAKAPRSNTIMLDNVEQQNVTRYYVSNNGGSLYKLAPPVKGAKIGSYKRKNGITDVEYRRVLSKIPPGAWDERIHTKNKSTYQERKTEFEKGYKTSVCNIASDFEWSNLNYVYYINEALKLTDPLMNQSS